MVKLGVIGLGSDWERRYRPALKRLAARARVSVVFDPVFSRAAQAAQECHAEVETGLLATAARPDVDALLLLDTAWYGGEAVRLVCSAGKPVYIAADVGQDAPMLQALHWTAVSYGLTLMPELRQRYTPASSRLQELMATRLGPPKRVVVEFSANGDEEAAVRRLLLNWFDWTRYVIRSTPMRLSAKVETPGGSGATIRIEYSPRRAGSSAAVAELRLGENGNGPPEIGRQEIECETGKACIESPTVIRWQSGADVTSETLTADRDETEVMLDHFCRRVVGGLIPVADLSDISRGLRLVGAVQESRDRGGPVDLNEPG